jgi:hypothetical protein
MAKSALKPNKKQGKGNKKVKNPIVGQTMKKKMAKRGKSKNPVIGQDL